MKLARARLILTVILFLGWLGYLSYLVAERPPKRSGDEEFVVLSRPQFLVSELDVVAEIKKGSDEVIVKSVLFPDTDAARQLQGKTIRVTNLAFCHPPDDHKRHWDSLKAEQKKNLLDVSQDGEYLLALHDPDGEGKEYRVAATPDSPSFMRGTPRAYPATSEVLAQYRQIKKK
jgi:hypothetical protein